MHRKTLESLYDHRYRRLNGDREALYWRCVYCGLPADTVDHFPPLSRVHDYDAVDESGIYVKFPCCRQCNSIAADVLDESFLDRIERVKNKLARKYAKYVRPSSDLWDEDELNELDYNLRSKVLENSKKSEIYLARIDYYDSVDIVLSQISEIYDL